jgi:hypothetical protein
MESLIPSGDLALLFLVSPLLSLLGFSSVVDLPVRSFFLISSLLLVPVIGIGLWKVPL